MKLTFLYQPVTDLDEAVTFYRDELGLDETWREGKTTAAFRLPGTEVELMLDTPPDNGPEWRAGGMFAVDSVETFVAEHPNIRFLGEVIDVPGGKSVAFEDPAGNTIHLMDQSAPEPAE